jgi:hypothetical protein
MEPANEGEMTMNAATTYPRAILDLIEVRNEVFADWLAAEDFTVSVEFYSLSTEDRVAGHRKVAALKEEWMGVVALIDREKARRGLI